MGERDQFRAVRERTEGDEAGLVTRAARRPRKLLVASASGGVLIWFIAGFFPAFHAPTPASAFSHLPAGAGRDVTSHYDQRLSGVVSRLAGRQAAAYCWSPGQWPAQVRQVGGKTDAWNAYTADEPFLTVNLSPQICGELTRLALLGSPLAAQADLDALAWSVGVLAHESIHAGGVDDERLAECYGMQRIARAAVMLGRSAADARLLAERFWKRLYRVHDATYGSPECRSGGALDLRPATLSWP
jgi:hypothetical protein